MRQGNFSEIRDRDLRSAHRPALPGQRHPRRPHQPDHRGRWRRHLPGAQPAGPRQQLRREQRAHADGERRRRAPRLPRQRALVALRAVLDGQAGLRRAGARATSSWAAQQLPTIRRNYNGVLGYTQTLGSNKFYELRVGYNRYWTAPVRRGLRHRQEQRARASRTATWPPIPETSGIASFRPAGLRATPARPGTTNADPRRHAPTTSPTTSPGSASKHNFKVGADVRLVQRRRVQPADAAAGPLHLRPATTRATAGAAGTGYSFASFLLGFPNRVQRDIVDTWPLIRRNFVGVFVQDDFRVSRKLSLQLGLRWDLMTPPVAGRQPAVELQTRRRPHPRRLRRQPRSGPQDALRLHRAAPRPRLHARQRQDGLPRRLRHQLLRGQLRGQRRHQRAQLPVLPGGRPHDARTSSRPSAA